VTLAFIGLQVSPNWFTENQLISRDTIMREFKPKPSAKTPKRRKLEELEEEQQLEERPGEEQLQEEEEGQEQQEEGQQEREQEQEQVCEAQDGDDGGNNFNLGVLRTYKRRDGDVENVTVRRKTKSPQVTFIKETPPISEVKSTYNMRHRKNKSYK
jgi:hypothetical protein